MEDLQISRSDKSANWYVFFAQSHLFSPQDVSQATRKYLLDILNEFRSDLKAVKYYEDYFARSAETGLKFCNKLGWFDCEGPFNKKVCTGLHRINPYGSRDARILFKTWNLDHQ